MTLPKPSTAPRLVRTLLGHLDEATAVAMLSTQRPAAPSQDVAARRARWSSAVVARKVSCGRPTCEPLPPTLRAAAERVAALPQFRSAFPGPVTSWAVIELAQLRVFQPTINLSLTGAIADDRVASLPAHPTPADLFAVSAPDPTPGQIDVHFDAAAMAFTVMSDNPNLRVIGPGGDPQQGLVGFILGQCTPWMSVAHYRDAYILRDGYHRAVALLSRGVETIPILVVECISYHETGGLQPGFLLESAVCGSSPPVVGDFLDPLLTADVEVPAVKRVIRLRPDTFLASA